MRGLVVFALLLVACDSRVVDAVSEAEPTSGTSGASSGPGAGANGTGGSAGTGGGNDSGGTGASPGEAGTQAGTGSDPPEPPIFHSLLHRYSFDGTGNELLDSRGAAHGAVLKAALSGRGTLELAGARVGEYVNLPNGLISGLQDLTMEFWLTWHGGGGWQRIFDFGDATAGSSSASADEDVQGNGRTYLFFTPATPAGESGVGSPKVLRLAYSTGAQAAEQVCDGPAALPTNTAVHLAVVVNAAAQTMDLYQDGKPLPLVQNGKAVEHCVLDLPLSQVRDINDWLGRSNYVDDPYFGGVYDEFRVYSAPLSAAQLARSFAAGPNASP